MTMCVWRQFGTAGGLETQNFLCLLSTNIIIEKIFVFLWFWLVFLLLCSMGNFLYYSLLILSKNDNVRNKRESALSTSDDKNILIWAKRRNFELLFGVFSKETKTECSLKTHFC